MGTKTSTDMKIGYNRGRITFNFIIGKKRENMPVKVINTDILTILFGIMMIVLVIAYL